jgi:hypothetical protein
MRPNPARRTRHAAGLLAGGLLLAPLAACSDATTDQRLPEEAESELSDALEETPDVDAPEVSCENDSCTVTLATGGEAEILGNTLAFTGTEGGTATVTVGDAETSCAEGESVSAGPLSLECTDVSDESLTLTATLE